MSARRAAGAVVVTLALLGGTAACGGDDVDTSSDPVEVEVGKAFSWNGYTVDDGWTLKGIERSVNGNAVTTPNVEGSITNTLDEERAPIFEMVFSTDGSPIATLSCSAAKMVKDQSQQFECPGLSATMPEDYDAVVVQEFVREDGSSSS